MLAIWARRFVNAVESGVSQAHKEAVISADYEGTIRTTIFSGRPIRTRATPLVLDWYCCLLQEFEYNRLIWETRETNRKQELIELEKKGIVAVGMDDLENRPFLMGEVAAVINVS
jgi:NAD(P)H-dependent flavin oxidoreductase YrpB (nitropropane dioxygenase family)